MAEEEFAIHMGRPRGRARSARSLVLAAAAQAGGIARRRAASQAGFGRGGAAALSLHRGFGPGARSAVVKARVVRQGVGHGRLAQHLDYLKREGVTRDGGKGRLFNAVGDDADRAAFARRCDGDRHHFRFIVSPDDAERLDDLKAFTRDLMAQAERDLDTPLDWIAADHWNTEHPHVHILVRGRDVDGEDLVISRDYISRGLRARAGELVTLELGPRPAWEQAQRLARQAELDRWTALDQRLQRQAGADGLIDLRPARERPADGFDAAAIRRLRKLQAMGLAEEARPGRWRLGPEAETVLKALGREGDIIARVHAAMRGQDAAADIDLGETPTGLVGRLAARGLDDELRGTAFAVVEGLDGKARHLTFPDLDWTTDAPVGALVEVRATTTAGRSPRLALTVRSDLPLQAQITAPGATWLDRQLVSGRPLALGGTGFGGEVREALRRRLDHLVAEGLAERHGGQVRLPPHLLSTLRQRELQTAARALAESTGLDPQALAERGTVAGTYRRRLDLASGRFAMIDDGQGFVLVPWRPELERRLGQTVSGVWRGREGMSWSFERARRRGR